MADPVRLGTRASTLARTQSGTVGRALARLNDCEYEEVLITTQGDDVSKPLNQPGSPGLFVTALRDALLAGHVDVIVHSFKDLPSAPEPGLVIAAIPPREDPRDALVARDGLTLSRLPAGSVVGTSSPRRAETITRYRPDLQVRPIRGNIDTRIRKVRDGEYDAVVLAAAGLARIGRLDEATEIFEAEIMMPAPAQGALAVECRADDVRMRSMLARLDDPLVRLATSAEREVLVGINAACSTAIAAVASYANRTLTLRAELTIDGVSRTAMQTAAIAADDLVGARAVGVRAAAQLLGAVKRRPVLLIRSEGNESDAQALAARGIVAVTDPYLTIAPSWDPEPAKRLLNDLTSAGEGTWLVATSPMAIPAWARLVGADTLHRAVRAAVARGVRAVATGPRTAASVQALGFINVLVAQDSSADGVVAVLASQSGHRALFPCSSIALPTIAQGLSTLGWKVEQATVYETATVSEVPGSSVLLAAGEIGAVVLRSPSAVRALTSFTDAEVPVICAGATTAAAARDAGLVVAGVANSPSADDVADAVAAFLAS